MTSYCAAVVDDQPCGAATNAFLCKACLRDVERDLGNLQSYRHEISLLATHQTRVYRANGNSDAELEQQRYETAQAELWEAEQRAKEAPIAPAYRDRSGRVALPQTQTMVNLGARNLLTEADTLIVGWARVLHEATSTRWFPIHEGPARPDGLARVTDPVTISQRPLTVERVLVWLTAKAESIRWHEAAPEIHRDITRLHRRMQRAVDRAPSRVYAGPCDTLADDEKCDRPLYSTAPPHFDNEDDRTVWWRDHPITCDGYRPPFDRSEGWAPGDRGCGAEHDREDRREWMLAEVEGRLLPLSLLQDTLPSLRPDLTFPARSTWWKWIRNRQLVPRTVIDGTEFYSGFEVIGIVLRNQKRINANTVNHRSRKQCATR